MRQKKKIIHRHECEQQKLLNCCNKCLLHYNKLIHLFAISKYRNIELVNNDSGILVFLDVRPFILNVGK